MDTNFWLLLSIGNRSEKVYKNMKFRYLYPIEVKNHGIYVWNRFHFEKVGKTLSCWKVLYIWPFSRHFCRQELRFFLFWMVNISQNMECESNLCLNWNWDTDTSSSLLNQVYSYLKEVDNKFFQNVLFVPLLEVFQKCLRSSK